MNIYGCATSSKIMAVLLLLLLGGIITVDDLINNDTKRAMYIGTVLKKFNGKDSNNIDIGEFFYGFYIPYQYQYKSKIVYLQDAYNYSGLQPGINILGILFKIGGDFPGVAPSHFICLYMNNDLTAGYNISSWVGNGVSPMQVTTFNKTTLDEHVTALTNNHITDISNEKKIEIAQFFNDPQANVSYDDTNFDEVAAVANNVFIKSSDSGYPGRQYFIFIMPQTFIMRHILPELASELAPAPAPAPASGFASTPMTLGGSKRRQKRRRSSSLFSKKRKTKHTRRRQRRQRRQPGY